MEYFKRLDSIMSPMFFNNFKFLICNCLKFCWIVGSTGTENSVYNLFKMQNFVIYYNFLEHINYSGELIRREWVKIDALHWKTKRTKFTSFWKLKASLLQKFKYDSILINSDRKPNMENVSQQALYIHPYVGWASFKNYIERSLKH